MANCLKLQIKALAEGKEKGKSPQRKKKFGHTKPIDRWGPQIKSRTWNLESQSSEIKFIKYVLPRSLTRTPVDCWRSIRERQAIKTQTQVLKAELSRILRRNLKPPHYVGALWKFWQLCHNHRWVRQKWTGGKKGDRKKQGMEKTNA